jgi:preprotein translocase subunit YajC
MHNILLQAQAPGGIPMQTIIMVGGMIIIFYFFMIRPQQKKTKDANKFREEIKRGDLIVTIGGLHGRVISQDKDTITLEVDRDVKLKFEKTAISMEATKKAQAALATPATTTNS